MHRGLGKTEGLFGPQSPLPGLAMFMDVHWPWRGSGERIGGPTQLACGAGTPKPVGRQVPQIGTSRGRSGLG